MSCCSSLRLDRNVSLTGALGTQRSGIETAPDDTALAALGIEYCSRCLEVGRVLQPCGSFLRPIYVGVDPVSPRGGSCHTTKTDGWCERDPQYTASSTFMTLTSPTPLTPSAVYSHRGQFQWNIWMYGTITADRRGRSRRSSSTPERSVATVA